MFIKYDKTYHVFSVTSKHNLDKTQLKRLLSGSVVIEEKMDGSNVGIIRHAKGFSLQKRNSLVGTSVHAQFDYFHNWANGAARERIMSVPSGTLIYGELLYATHHIYYDRLPEYFLVFDVRHGKKWMKYDERKEFCERHGFHMVPLVDRGNFTKDDLRDAVRSLPFRRRNIFLLRIIGELTYKEIAAFLDIPIGSVMGELFRARHQLRVTFKRNLNKKETVKKEDSDDL